MRNTAKWIGMLLLFTAAAVWGFAFSMQAKAAEWLGPLSVNGIRYLIAALFLIPCILLFDRGTGRRLLSRQNGRLCLDITKREWLGGSLSGIILFVATNFQQLGIAEEETGAGKAAFITALYVVLVPLMGLFRKKRPGFTVWLGIGIAVLGFYLLTADLAPFAGLSGLLSMLGNSFHFVTGDLLVFVCAIIFALHVTVIDIFSPNTDGVRLSFVQFLTAGVISLPLFLLIEAPDAAAIGQAVLPLLYLGIFSSAVGYTLQILGQKRVNVSVAPMILSLESVFGVIGGAILLGEKLSAVQYIGCATVFAAVILSQLADLRASAKQKNEA